MLVQVVPGQAEVQVLLVLVQGVPAVVQAAPARAGNPGHRVLVPAALVVVAALVTAVLGAVEEDALVVQALARENALVVPVAAAVEDVALLAPGIAARPVHIAVVPVTIVAVRVAADVPVVALDVAAIVLPPVAAVPVVRVHVEALAEQDVRVDVLGVRGALDAEAAVLLVAMAGVQVTANQTAAVVLVVLVAGVPVHLGVQKGAPEIVKEDVAILAKQHVLLHVPEPVRDSVLVALPQ